MKALEVKNLVRTFEQGGREIRVLRGANLSVEAGQVIGLLGQSGSGKSTLLHIAGLLERPNSGAVVIDGQDCSDLAEGERTLVRRNELGFVYQFHHLLSEFTALENVAIPQRIAGRSKGEAKTHAAELLSSLGLSERLDHRPAELSGGEQQRVAMARAMANSPTVLLADEPTGNLDESTADIVLETLIEAIRTHRLAAVIATHNMELANRMDLCLRLHDGVLAPA
jgi:lipoprotein-releasing system ATP-binding protein